MARFRLKARPESIKYSGLDVGGTGRKAHG